MTRPTVPAPAERVYDGLSAFQPGDEAGGFNLLWWVVELVAILGRSQQILRHDDRGSGLRRLLSPSRCPDALLPWLAQFIHCQVLPDDTPDRLRARIIANPWWLRGTIPPLLAAAASTLTGTRSVQPLERFDPTGTGDQPGHITLRVRSSEMIDPVETKRVAQTATAAGLILHIITDGDVLIDEGERVIDTSADVTIDAAVLADVT